MKIDLNNKDFKQQKFDENEDLYQNTVFHFIQEGDTIRGEYSGGEIERGHLFGKRIKDLSYFSLFNHFTREHKYYSGRCTLDVTNTGKKIQVQLVLEFFSKTEPFEILMLTEC